MRGQGTSSDNYLLGDTPFAIRRLRLLAQIYEPFTQRAFADAGITRGMRVLDLGSGLGDVSLIAADLVGETGYVLGVDASTEMLQVARSRAAASGKTHIAFMAGDVRDLTVDAPFDALVGRFILMHLPEPETILRRLLHYVRPGGLVVFQEYNLSSEDAGSSPPSTLWEHARRLAILPWQQAGGNVHAGMQLPTMFRAAGLPEPQLRYEAAIGADADWPGFEMMAADVRTFLPLIAKYDLATEEEIDIDTLAERMRQEIISSGGAARLPVVVSAWTHTTA